MMTDFRLIINEFTGRSSYFLDQPLNNTRTCLKIPREQPARDGAFAAHRRIDYHFLPFTATDAVATRNLETGSEYRG
ncbi:MAG TPA: hypothetical protein VLN56_03150 [Gammaproteobacteria bacterium]|nr:hypothetical protein [Gammaproteobacteria bacterium]